MSNTSNAAMPSSAAEALAASYGMSESHLRAIAQRSAFRNWSQPPTTEQVDELLSVAARLGLNPAHEVYAMPSPDGGIIPVVGVDGWVTLIQRQPDYRGMSFTLSDDRIQPDGALNEAHIWIEATIHRDGMHPTTVREYLAEVYVPPIYGPGPWQTHPTRMHRHKAFVQAVRMAYGFSGVYDADEASRIVKGRPASSLDDVPVSVEQDSGDSTPSAALPTLAELGDRERTLYDQVMTRAQQAEQIPALRQWVRGNQKIPARLRQLLLHELVEPGENLNAG